jgi:dienelactone hydrolase
MKRIDSDFLSRSKRCAGWLFLPEGREKPPVVIMAHGFSGQRDFGLEPYARHFATGGMAVFVFDYRNFGGSEGKPRNLVNPWRHIRDWRSAIAHVRSLKDVDGSRVALWGTSFSGGHVMVASARDRGIKAVVAQVPFADGISTTMSFPLSFQLQGLYHGLKDLSCMIRRKPAHTVPAVGRPDTFALMNTPDAVQGYYSLVPPDITFVNSVPARAALMVPFYRPIRYARRVTCPVLVMYAKNDSLIPSRAVQKMGDRIPKGEVVGLPAGHFDFYTGDLFRRVVRVQTEFLVRHLFEGTVRQ